MASLHEPRPRARRELSRSKSMGDCRAATCSLTRDASLAALSAALSAARSGALSSTYSTSAIVDVSESGIFTLNTLSMISSPWNTESWESRLSHVTFQARSGASSRVTPIVSSLTLTTFTPHPRSSTSVAVASPSVRTVRKDSWTIRDAVSVASEISQREMIHLHERRSKDTISSWTIQSFTSTGALEDEDPNVVKANYPWSPRSVQSCISDLSTYPSSVSTVISKYPPLISTPVTNSQINVILSRLVSRTYAPIPYCRQIKISRYKNTFSVLLPDSRASHCRSGFVKKNGNEIKYLFET